MFFIVTRMEGPQHSLIIQGMMWQNHYSEKYCVKLIYHLMNS